MNVISNFYIFGRRKEFECTIMICDECEIKNEKKINILRNIKIKN
jgi:hypothetical protein